MAVGELQELKMELSRLIWTAHHILRNTVHSQMKQETFLAQF